MALQLFRQPTFSAGELSYTLYGRTDIPRYSSGVKVLRNFIATKQGPVKNRAGFEFISEVYDSTHKVRLEAFVFSSDQAYLLEIGHLYIQAWQNGAQAGARVTTTYTEDEIFKLKFSQIGDVLTITHENHVPATLSRTAGPTWTLADISFIRSAYTGPYPEFRGLAVDGEVEGNWARPYDLAYPFKKWEWVACAVDKDTKRESLPCPVLVTALADWAAEGVTTDANYFEGCIRLYPDNAVVLVFDAGISELGMANVEYYNIYRGRDGVYGYVGRAQHLLNVNGTWTHVDGGSGVIFFMDEALTPILNQVPPTGNNPFLNDNPAVNCFFQGRRFFANLATDASKVWGSKTNDYTGFDPPEYPGADDGFYFVLASRYLEEIRWLLPLRTLLVGTNNGVWAVGGAQGSALTTGSIDARLQLSMGSSWLDPLIVGNSLLYTLDKSGYVTEALYTQESDGYKTMDLSLWAQHLFDGYSIDDWTYQQLPDSVVWCVRSDGALLGLTYMREQEIWGWHEHDTEGLFESVCSVPEGGKDRLYAVVKREESRFIERLDTREHAALKDYVFLDSAKVQTRASSTAVTGLGHLEGFEVYALADGEVQGPFTVSGGSITLAFAAATVIVGLPYVCDLELLELYAGSAEVRGIYKTVARAMFEVTEASYLQAGEDFDNLTVWTSKTQAGAYLAPTPTAELVEIYVRNTWNKHGRACLRSTKPLPVTVVAAIREVAFGG
jgi:hypothetical protein